MILRKELELSKEDYYKVHLALVNAVLPNAAKLTEKELEVLAYFMSLPDEIPLGRFGTYARKLVKEKMKINDSGLANYLRFLKNKRFILEKDNKLIFVPLINIPSDEQSYSFTIKNKERNE